MSGGSVDAREALLDRAMAEGLGTEPVRLTVIDTEHRQCAEALLLERLRNTRRHYGLSVLLGCMLVIYCCAGYVGRPGSAWLHVLSFFPFADASLWLGIMGCVGVIQIAGPTNRSLRHIGFVLGALTWLSVFGMFAISGSWVPMVCAPMLFAIYSAGAWVDEVYTTIKYSRGVTNEFFADAS